SENSGFGLPFGRPKCESSTTTAPRSSSARMVGMAARIRVSSDTRPSSSSGTLKSTRTRARRPRTSLSLRSAIVLRSITDSLPRERLAHHPEQVHATAGVAPLVVIPPGNLHQRPVDHVGALPVQDAGVRVADVVRGDKLFLGVLQEALE